jgi:transcriptional regulator with XRE-family HTH domain
VQKIRSTFDDTMPRTRKRNAVDQHVGARVRARRKAIGMNQSALANRLGVTFQMVQRYEYGLCRIAASTLYAMAFALDVPMSYFFDGLPLPATSSKRIEPGPAEASSIELAKTQHGRELALLFPRVTHRGCRRAIVELVRAMAGDAD